MCDAVANVHTGGSVPEMDRATASGAFAAARLVTALRLVSWNTSPPGFRPATNPTTLQGSRPLHSEGAERTPFDVKQRTARATSAPQLLDDFAGASFERYNVLRLFFVLRAKISGCVKEDRAT